MAATLDGNAIFGVAVCMKEQANVDAAQINQFFGVLGVQYLSGGSRGRGFFVNGVLMASSDSGLEAAKANIFAFKDGNTHTLVDTRGVTWLNVIFQGDFQWQEMPRWTLNYSARCQPYQLVMLGLT